jgi:hypothetical protein
MKNRETEQRLLNALAIYVIVAWRIHSLTMAGRASPAMSCEVVFASRECHSPYTIQPYGQPPPLHEMGQRLARLGGYFAWRDGEPGMQTIWQGY